MISCGLASHWPCVTDTDIHQRAQWPIISSSKVWHPHLYHSSWYRDRFYHQSLASTLVEYCRPVCSCEMFCCYLSDVFVRSWLRTHHVDEPVWRTGGLRQSNNNTFYWYRRGSRSRHQAFTYTAWPASHDPAVSNKRVTLVLRRLEMPGEEDTGAERGGMQDSLFHWDMELPGSAKRPDSYAYPFICEVKANSKLNLTFFCLVVEIFIVNFVKIPGELSDAHLRTRRTLI